MIQQSELTHALALVLDYVMSGRSRVTQNHFLAPQVQTGLKTLARAEGFSAFGHDWMDALENYKNKEQTNDQTIHPHV